MANIFQLFGQIFIDNSEADKSIDKTTKKAESSGSKIGAVFSSITKGAAAIGTAAVGTAATLGTAAYAMANATAGQADVIDKLSERTSINREELQRWMHAADQSGVSSDVFESAVKKMSSTLDDAGQGSSTALDSLSRLGLTLEDLDGLSTEQKFDKITSALADMEDGTERNALGADLLGKAYTEMLPLLNAGSEGINALKQEADDLGIVMSEDAVKAGVVLGDTIANVKAAFNGVMNQLGNAIIPVVQKFADFIIKSLPTIQKLVEKISPLLVDIFEQLLPPLLELIEEIFPILIGLVETLLPIITDIITSILPVVILLLQTIAPLLEALMPLLAPILDILLSIIKPLVELLNLILPPLIDFVTKIIEKIMPALQLAFSSVASSLSAHFKTAFEAVGNIFMNIKNIFQNIIDFVKNVFTGNWSAAWQNVKNIFSSIWDNLVTIVKTPINFIINAINTLIGGINKISFDVPDWVPGIGGKALGFNIPTIPKLRRGLDYVPRDNYPALLHRGERVLTDSERREQDQELEEKKKDTSKEKNVIVKVNVHIEHFENHSSEDLEELTDEMMHLIEEKIRDEEDKLE